MCFLDRKTSHRTGPQAQTPGMSGTAVLLRFPKFSAHWMSRKFRPLRHSRLPVSSTGRGRRSCLLRLANFPGGHECPCENWSAAPGCGTLLLLRASQRSRKRQTAAPAPPRLFLPQAAPRLRSQRRLPVSSTGRSRRRCLASYRAAGPNVTNEPERKGSAELPEIRKVHGTQ